MSWYSEPPSRRIHTKQKTEQSEPLYHERGKVCDNYNKELFCLLAIMLDWLKSTIHTNIVKINYSFYNIHP